MASFIYLILFVMYCSRFAIEAGSYGNSFVWAKGEWCRLDEFNVPPC